MGWEQQVDEQKLIEELAEAAAQEAKKIAAPTKKKRVHKYVYFDEGAVVAMNGQQVLMTVENDNGMPSMKGFVYCVWFDNNAQVRRGIFRVEALYEVQHMREADGTPSH